MREYGEPHFLRVSSVSSGFTSFAEELAEVPNQVFFCASFNSSYPRKSLLSHLAGRTERASHMILMLPEFMS